MNNKNDYPEYPASLQVLNDTMRFASSRENFEINKVTVCSPDKEPLKAYFVALRGTDQSFDKTDVLGIPVCLKSFLSKHNIYFDLVKETMLADIPEGATVIFAGHSLGGMVAQQAAGDVELNHRYNIINLLTIGSPFVAVTGRKCPLRRFVDKADFIPWLGKSFKANLFTEKPVFKSNGYWGKPVLAHTDSYRLSDSWREYDALGIPNGKNVIVFDSAPVE